VIDNIQRLPERLPQRLCRWSNNTPKSGASAQRRIQSEISAAPSVSTTLASGGIWWCRVCSCADAAPMTQDYPA
jgi:hypothetical protein